MTKKEPIYEGMLVERALLSFWLNELLIMAIFSQLLLFLTLVREPQKPTSAFIHTNAHMYLGQPASSST